MSSSIVPKVDVVKELEVTIDSAINLQHPHPSLSTDSYVSVALVSPHTKPKFHKTNTHINGGTTPKYGYMVIFPLSQDQIRMAINYNLVCKVKHKGSLRPDRTIGTVTVSLQTLLDTEQGDKVEYPVVIDGNVERGKLVISHKLVGKNGGDDDDEILPSSSPPPMGPGSSSGMQTVVDGVMMTAGVTTIAKNVYEVIKESN